MQDADSITELYREHTQGGEPSEELVAQLPALPQPGEDVRFTCGLGRHEPNRTHPLVVALAGGGTLQREHLRNHQIEPAAAALEAALDALD